MRILSVLRCALFGHVPLVLESCNKTDALMHVGIQDISLAKVQLCRRCMAIFWTPGDSVKEKTITGVIATDMVYAQAGEKMRQMAERMESDFQKNVDEYESKKGYDA